MAEKLEVLERGENLVLAAHFTKVGTRVATTVEIVRFERPERIRFRLVRGPVPHVVEQFAFAETVDGTELTYTGELGTDLWALGRAWGNRVAEKWEAAVRSSLESVRVEAERQPTRGFEPLPHRGGRSVELSGRRLAGRRRRLTVRRSHQLARATAATRSSPGRRSAGATDRRRA